MPVHEAFVRPGAAPKRPAGHALQCGSPALLYVPGLHRPPHAGEPNAPLPDSPAAQINGVEFVDAAGHQCPNAHGPLQPDDTSPGALP